MPAWLQRDWCSPFVLSLGHFVWQGTLIAVLLAIALRATKSVAARYWLSLTVLLVMAACPIVTLGWLMWPVSQGSGVQNSKLAAPVSESPTILDPPILNFEHPTPPSDVGQVSNLPVIPSAPLVELNTDPSGRSPNLQAATDDRSWWQKFAPQLTSTYLCGVGLMLLRLVAGLWGGRRLRRRVHLIDDPSLLAAMQRQAVALGLKLLPVLAYCERVTVPTVVGVLKPMILLPLTLTSGLSPEQIESVLAHELAHLRRYDHLVNLLQRVIESLLFFHPAMWWVSHRIREEREHCCDDLVVACGAMPLDYAKSLLVVAELSRASKLRRSVAAVSLLATGDKPSSLRQRISRLLGESATPSLRVSPRALMLAIAIPLVALIVAIQSGVSNLAAPDEEQIRQERAAYQVLHQLKSRLANFHTDTDGEYEFEQFRRGEELGRLRVHDPVRPLAERRLAKPVREATIWFVKDAADWALIGELQSIERLSFTASDLRGHMDELKKLTRLRRFEVFNSKFDFDDLAQLSQHPQLEQIEVMSSIFDGSDDQIAKQLGEMTDDERQWLDRWIASRPADSPNHRVAHAALLTDRALRNFGELKQLKTLKLINTFATGHSAETLSELTRLEELDVSFLSLDADAGRNLSRLRKLKRLGNSYVNDAALAELASLPELEHAEFWCKEVTDAGATSLSRCRKLRHLLLGTSQITDAGLDALSDLPDLRVLDLRFGAKAVTVEAIERFRVRHPDCNLSLSDDTLGAGSATPPETPTARLPKSDEETDPAINANGDLRSNPAAGAGDYSETTELVLSINSLKFMLDLDSGQTMDPPQTIRPEQKKMDVYPLGSRPNEVPAGLQGVRLRGIRTKSDGWFVSVADLQKELASERVGDLKTLPYDANEKATYFFRTADGTDGILQLLAQTDEPKGIRLCYKTFKASKVNAEIKVGMTLDELIALKGRHYRLSHGMREGNLILVYDDIAISVDAPLSAKGVAVAKVTGFEPGIPKEVVQNVPYADEETSPRKGLEFLKPYPKLHGLSLDMTEPQFLEIVKQQELKTRKTVEGEKVTHRIALGDGHTLIVMFDKDAKCSGIQRVRGEDDGTRERTRPQAELGHEKIEQKNVSQTKPSGHLQLGTLSGRFVFDGEPPVLKDPYERFANIDVNSTPLGPDAKLDGVERMYRDFLTHGIRPKTADQTVLVGKDGGIANVVVWLVSRDVLWT